MTNSGPLDVLGFIGRGKRYDDVAKDVTTIDIGGLPARVLNLRALGREKDQVVLRIL